MEKTRSVKNSLWTARNKMGFSQKRVACALGLKRTSVLSRYEHGKRIPGLINALKLEIVYRTPVAFLFSDLYLELKGQIRKKEEQINFGKVKKLH
jgi:transcriptional regulator with XRE-family HTH domain